MPVIGFAETDDERRVADLALPCDRWTGILPSETQTKARMEWGSRRDERPGEPCDDRASSAMECERDTMMPGPGECLYWILYHRLYRPCLATPSAGGCGRGVAAATSSKPERPRGKQKRDDCSCACRQGVQSKTGCRRPPGTTLQERAANLQRITAAADPFRLRDRRSEGRCAQGHAKDTQRPRHETNSTRAPRYVPVGLSG